MRKNERDNLTNIIKLMDETVTMLWQSVESRDSATAFSILQSLQDTAVHIGTAIEKTEGEGHATVKFLEAFCEHVFLIGESLQAGDFAEDATLKGELRKIRKSLERDVKIRREVVFLPYKASMWDSFESVWRAADADPDCDAYVIPIPYYDKNPDGTPKEMHYEGDEYPADIPITKYDEYAFEQRRPDMIFILNPYDDCNIVTSVLPFFYTENLLKMTDCLVYIPYFILGEPNPKSATLMDDIGHFVLAPGVRNATRVIVQSSKMKEAYIRILTRKYGMQHRKEYEEKILGLGSPKVDRTLEAASCEQEIPVQWEALIKREDGGRKRVIFYNTGIAAFLKDGEAMLEKIRNSIDIFRSFKREVVLLWRPHPLLRSTIESMRPTLLEAYDQLVADYRNEGFGIYDDTPDMERAVAISDAYYGDDSSVLHLYTKTGKPVMIQNPEVICEVTEREPIFPARVKSADGRKRGAADGANGTAGTTALKKAEASIGATIYEALKKQFF